MSKITQSRRSRPSSMYVESWHKIKDEIYIKSHMLTNKIHNAFTIAPMTTIDAHKKMSSSVSPHVSNTRQHRRSWSPWLLKRSLDDVEDTRTPSNDGRHGCPKVQIPKRFSSAPPPLSPSYSENSTAVGSEDDLLRCLKLAHVYLDAVLPYHGSDIEDGDNDDEDDEEEALDGCVSDDEYESDEEDNVLPRNERTSTNVSSQDLCIYQNPACASSFILPIYGRPERTLYKTSTPVDQQTIERWQQEDNCRSYWSDDSEDG